MGGSGLAISSWLARSCVIQPALHLFKMGMLAVKSLISDTYTTFEKRKDLKQEENLAPFPYPLHWLLKFSALPTKI